MSNVKLDKQEGTKGGLPHTSEEGQGRVTAESVVTDGDSGIVRLQALTKQILARREVDDSSQRGDPGPETPL